MGGQNLTFIKSNWRQNVPDILLGKKKIGSQLNLLGVSVNIFSFSVEICFGLGQKCMFSVGKNLVSVYFACHTDTHTDYIALYIYRLHSQIEEDSRHLMK